MSAVCWRLSTSVSTINEGPKKNLWGFFPPTREKTGSVRALRWPECDVTAVQENSILHRSKPGRASNKNAALLRGDSHRQLKFSLGQLRQGRTSIFDRGGGTNFYSLRNNTTGKRQSNALQNKCMDEKKYNYKCILYIQ